MRLRGTKTKTSFTMAAIKIVLADDQKLFRSGLSSLFQPFEKNGLALVAEAANGKEAIKAVMAHQPDVVLMDVVMPEMDGVEATRQIKELRPQTGVIALSFTDDQPRTCHDRCGCGRLFDKRLRHGGVSDGYSIRL